MAIRISREGHPTTQHRARRNIATALLQAAANEGVRETPVEHTRLTPEERALNADAIDVFAQEIGGRETLFEILSIADSEGVSGRVHAVLLEDRYRGSSLRTICTHAGITVAELFAAYKKALFVRAHIKAAHIIAAQLPPIVEDVMRRARPMPLPCPPCNGMGSIPGTTTPCRTCGGTGQVMSEPELERQKLALELGHLTASHTRANVLVQQNAVATSNGSHVSQTFSGSGSLEQLQQAVGDLLFSPGRRRAAAPRVIEADVVPQTAPPGAEGAETAGGEGSSNAPV